MKNNLPIVYPLKNQPSYANPHSNQGMAYLEW